MFVLLTLWDLETSEWQPSHVRTTDIVRVASASEVTHEHAPDAGSELIVASGAALLARESPTVVLARIGDADDE